MSAISVILSPGIRHCPGSLRRWLRDMVAVCVLVTLPCAVQAQSRDRDKDKADGASPLQLETRLTKAEESLLKEYMDVSNEYYKQGEKEASLAVLQKVAKLNPKLEGLKQRMDGIHEELLQANGIKTEIDAAKSWVVVCEVEEGKPFRLQASGDYKLDYTTIVPLTGLSTSDPAVDHVSAAPFGALIGVVVTDGKPGDPFAVNAGVEHTSKKSGLLYLRVNVPAAAKCKGDIKIQISGGVKALKTKR